MILHFLPFFFWQFHNFSAFAIWFLLQNAFLQQGSLKLTFSLKVLQKKKRRGRGVLQKDFIILYILAQVISKRLNFNFIKHSLLNSRAFWKYNCNKCFCYYSNLFKGHVMYFYLFVSRQETKTYYYIGFTRYSVVKIHNIYIANSRILDLMKSSLICWLNKHIIVTSVRYKILNRRLRSINKNCVCRNILPR